MLGFPENESEIPFVEDTDPDAPPTRSAPDIKPYFGEFEKELDKVKERVDDVENKFGEVKTLMNGLEQKTVLVPDEGVPSTEIKLTHFGDHTDEFEKELDTVKKKVDAVGNEVSEVKTRMDGLERKTILVHDERALSPDIESQLENHSDSFVDNICFL